MDCFIRDVDNLAFMFIPFQVTMTIIIKQINVLLIQTKAFPRFQCLSLWVAGILFFRVVHMSDWHCESRSDAVNQEDLHGCLEQCYTWRESLEPVCLSDQCSPLLPHVKKSFLLKCCIFGASMMGLLIVMIVASIFCERRLASSEGRVGEKPLNSMGLEVRLPHRSISRATYNRAVQKPSYKVVIKKVTQLSLLVVFSPSWTFLFQIYPCMRQMLQSCNRCNPV